MHENLDAVAKDYPENLEEYHEEEPFYVGERIIVSYLRGIVWSGLHEYTIEEISEKHIKLSGTWYNKRKNVIIEERLKPKSKKHGVE